MMENKLFRWISFAVTVILAIVAICVGTISGFLCFAAAAFILIPVNHLFEKLDGELDSKYRKRATAITAGIFLVCGLLAFTTAGSGSDSQTDMDTVTTTTTAITTTTERTTEPTTTTTKETTTTTTTTTEETTTTTVTTTTDEPVIETEPPTEAPTEPPTVQNDVSQSQSNYVVNTSTEKFHRPSCRDVDKISPENRWDYTGSKDDLTSQGYSPCGHCNP